MNGVIAPSFSAGSSQRAARVTCTAHVICPSGAAAAGPAGSRQLAETISTPTIQVSAPMSPRPLPLNARALQHVGDVLRRLLARAGVDLADGLDGRDGHRRRNALLA